ncbi:MAG: UDP-N-acetylmuramate--L-alanine ligase [Candidatus Marinimicrobia bacterium]|nr:UDP-N-acetylmuramate--L-alanine ligase [Candidatus Neomarinimicrobiota bacterium]MBL7023285.1 UDP-N-acetylmuramate--L-alanine ligase [Candidatus Neomarinimicrobiota bacterium]MBL7108879.1 UDP-N-acetylmuramate--L-alanine ligase [Candidatus Neomarinimicrobiota bacterium]
MFGKTKIIHFVGIGGIGMSGMAELLFNLGFSVSGSDKMKSERTEHLESLGISFFEGHSADNVKNCDVLVYSSAVKLDNPEIIEAHHLNIPVIRRAEMLGELLKVKDISIAVGGTHGKTTTSSMLGSILSEANVNPTLVIGGIVNDVGSNALSGSGDVIVVEADEFDRTFLSLQPTMSIITSIELEHLDCYDNLEDIKNTFSQFANAVPFYGIVSVCIDDRNVQQILPNIKRPIITYGLTNQADIQAKNISYENHHSVFTVYKNLVKLGDVKLNAPGEHNIQNALASISISLELDIPFVDIQSGLAKYSGVRRRFEIRNETKSGIMFVDDYAHHPSEVQATLNAARSGWDKRIVAVFQPHLYSRTRDFYQDFALAFMHSDVLVVTDVYPAREEPIDGVSGKLISDNARTIGHKNVVYVQKKEDLPTKISKILKPNDIVITMGAGDIWKFNDLIFEELTK